MLLVEKRIVIISTMNICIYRTYIQLKEYHKGIFLFFSLLLNLITVSQECSKMHPTPHICVQSTNSLENMGSNCFYFAMLFIFETLLNSTWQQIKRWYLLFCFFHFHISFYEVKVRPRDILMSESLKITNAILCYSCVWIYFYVSLKVIF